MEYKKIKILIVVKGGIVQSIYSTDERIQFDILDFDNEELDNDEEKEVLNLRSKDLFPIL